MGIAINTKEIEEGAQPASLLQVQWDDAGNVVPVESSDPRLAKLPPSNYNQMQNAADQIAGHRVIIDFVVPEA